MFRDDIIKFSRSRDCDWKNNCKQGWQPISPLSGISFGDPIAFVLCIKLGVMDVTLTGFSSYISSFLS